MKDWTGNSNSIYKTLGASNHTDKEREENDFYATDPIAIDKLFKAIKTPVNVWECACGLGHLSKRIKELSPTTNVLSSDIVKRDGFDCHQIDFLSVSPLFSPFNNEKFDIITNPPYKYAMEFVEKTLTLDYVNDVYMLLKLQFLEGKKRFDRLFSYGKLEKIYVFSQRLLCAKNGDFATMRKGGGSAVAYAWFKFGRNCKNPTIAWL